LAGAALALAGSRSATLGGCLGPVGAVAGALVGHRYRTALGRALPVPDAVWAIAEDLVAIGGGILIVSRFRS
jgi:uncharacterized membrane protein